MNRVVYQAFLTAAGLSVILGAVGWFAAPSLLDLVNAAPDVRAEALPFLRTMLVGILGMMIFFMLSGAFRAAGDSRTPLRLGVMMTALTIAFNVVLIPIFGTIGAALGYDCQQHDRRRVRRVADDAARLGDPLRARHEQGAGLRDHPLAVPLRPADRRAGHRDERRRPAAAAVHRIAPAERGGAGRLRGRLHRAVLADHVDVGRVDGRGGDDRRTEPGRGPSRAGRSQGVWVASKIGLALAAGVGLLFLAVPGYLLAVFGMTDPVVLEIGEQLLRYLAVSGLFVTVALCFTGALQGTGDTRSPLYISIVSQIVVPLGLCAVLQATRRPDRRRHLAGDRARPHDPMRPQRGAVPAAEMA